MRALGCIGLALLLAAPDAARAQESLDDLDAGKSKVVEEIKPPTVEANGYINNRLQFTWVNVGVPLPTRDVPTFQELLEGNVQLKIRLGGKAFAYADLSLFYQTGGLYYEQDAAGERTRVPDHDVASLHPFFIPSELYVSWSPRPWLNLLLGKKRIVWGSGLAFNPTDLVNPPRDPTDPNFQRAGSWLARVELPFEKFTLTALWAPQVLAETAGIPYNVLKHPDYEDRPAPDSDVHHLLALRLYMLLYNSDINLIYAYSNRFRDDIDNRSRFGASFSRYFFTDYELHVEALFQQGTSRLYPVHACAAFGRCDPTNPSTILRAENADSSALFPRVLVGGRTMFKDESTLSVEYYYQSDGYDDTQLGDFYAILLAARRFNLGLPFGGQSTAQGGLPQRFSFDPLRRHYLILSYVKPKIRDDWTVSGVLVASLNDLSGLLSASVSWNALQWLNLSLYAFVPIRGIPVGQIETCAAPNTRCGDGMKQAFSEYSLIPNDFRLLFEVKAFY